MSCSQKRKSEDLNVEATNGQNLQMDKRKLRKRKTMLRRSAPEKSTSETTKPVSAAKTPPPKCTDCRQYLDDSDLKFFQGILIMR
ncbi:hypothetical protein F7725_003270 [Dissostichus mawsoni]|uniref:Uncharacterized protein n=1 Tax=Dissostichus mawsoni TaxID=36200 RepID=A0A7J5Y9S5_DISMA|nr:hypothetical protein F7725_003270 [Dissostichus mawsoni]